jgi:hypothetical protein
VQLRKWHDYPQCDVFLLKSEEGRERAIITFEAKGLKLRTSAFKSSCFGLPEVNNTAKDTSFRRDQKVAHVVHMRRNPIIYSDWGAGV